jgi:erythromycin esterase-like protein
LVPELCEDEVVTLLKDLQQRSPVHHSDFENAFSTEQNALVAVNAEKYYRSMLNGSAESWNIRDSHMQETLERLLEFHGPSSKAIVWEHNTHIGDARATDMTEEGMYNIGELARVHFGDDQVVLVGFGSYKGTVIAGKSWGAPMQRMNMPVAREGSWEDLLHKASAPRRLLLMDKFTGPLFHEKIGHRAIGVVYRPEYESYGNYVPSILPERYDAFIYIDETSALHPLHMKADGHLVPETYPFGV